MDLKVKLLLTLKAQDSTNVEILAKLPSDCFLEYDVTV